MSNFIKVWCEYDIGGSFGGNNNEEVFNIPEHISDIESCVLKHLMRVTCLEEEDLEDLYDWEFIEISELGE